MEEEEEVGGGSFVPGGLALDCQELRGDWGMRRGSEDGGGVAGSWGGRGAQRWRALTLYSSPAHLIWLEVI